MHFVYMIKNSADKLYTGITKNPQDRVYYHNERRGSQFTKHIKPIYFERSRGTYKIVFLEEYPSLAEARKREVQIKRWRREKKEMLVERYKNGLSTKL